MGYAGEVEWMNTEGNAMMGFTAHRDKWATNGYTMVEDGVVKAWWQGADFKHAYPDAIPTSEVERVMLNWEPQEADIAVKVYVDGHETWHGSDEKGYYVWLADEDRKAIVRADREAIFGYFGRDSYKTHNYLPVLEQCNNIVDSTELGIASAFMMDEGAVFVANMELPDDITTSQGIDHRVKLMVCTSMNGRFATLWKIVDEFSVCSNSFNLQLNGKGNEFRVKHTSRSLGRINDARTALGLVYKAAEEYTAFLDAMTQVDITDAQFKVITANLFPVPDPVVDLKGQVTNQRARTIADNKQGRLHEMWDTSPQVAPFNGTLFGAFQAYSTWNQWERPTSKDGLQASILGTVTDSFAKADQEFFDIVRQLHETEVLDLGALVPA